MILPWAVWGIVCFTAGYWACVMTALLLEGAEEKAKGGDMKVVEQSL
jgi:hypothetical protein